MAKPRQSSSTPRAGKRAGMKQHGRSPAERRGHPPLTVPFTAVSADACTKKSDNVISSPDLDPKPRSPVLTSQDDNNDLPVHPTSAHPSSIPAPAAGISHSAPALEEQPAKRRKIALDMTQLVNNPACFDGRSVPFHNWAIEMENYLSAVCYDPSMGVGIATQFLRGDAMKWWSLNSRQLVRAGHSLPLTWIDFQPYLAERFDHKNPELAARTKLQLLRQHNMTVHQYLRGMLCSHT